VKQTSYHLKKKLVKEEKKLDKYHYWQLIVLMILGVLYHYFIEPKTIGNDNRYLLYIFLLPTIGGMLILVFYRRKFLKYRFSTNKEAFLWSYMTLLYLTQGFLFSYLSFGQIAKVGWDYINYQTAKNNNLESITCDVDRFWAKRSYSFDYKFMGNYESFIVPYTTIKGYKDKNPRDYQLNIQLRKGIWNYYLVESWTINHK